MNPLSKSPARTPNRRRGMLKAFAGLAVGGVALSAGAGLFVERRGSLYEVRQERTLMQTSVAVNCLSSDLAHARFAIGQAYARMAETASILTRFDPRSPLSALNRRGRLADPPPRLREVLEHALRLSRITGGAFDATVLPVLSCVESFPEPVVLTGADRGDIAAAKRLVNYRDVELGERHVALRRAGMAVTLDGIAKGYVVDQGIAALKQAGIEYGLVDAGGDVQAFSGSDPNRHWNVGIVDPANVDEVAEVVQLRNGALSTSGNYRIFYSSDRSLFHIIDPGSGYSPQAYSSVTVLAHKSVIADGMSTGSFSLALGDLADLMVDQGHQWLVFSRDTKRRWRSRGLPLISGRAEVL
ncbi:FAD:protein FMN transferase [Thiomonas sp.]|uniref:FAD:protein FMN transferase n=1 Tax=Thiomonas sp. TaxID=2047785 RepID=UPI00260957C2|nr:FAD:protein FMN transferase [Thiomonas sp.]